MAILLCVHHLPCLQIFLFYNPKVLHFCTDSLQLSRWVGLWNSQSHHQGPRCSYMLVQLCAKGTYLLLSPKIPLKKQNRKGWGKAATEGARSNIMPAPEASYVTGIERIWKGHCAETVRQETFHTSFGYLASLCSCSVLRVSHKNL